MKNKKILLVDGNSLIFRAYFASAYTGNILRTKSGIPTNAVYSFVNMLSSLLNENDYYDVVVAFDKGKKTFRHDKMPDYKAGRSKTPDELVTQFPIVREFLQSANIAYFEIENIEADDIIGSISQILFKDNEEYLVEILTSDKDMFQLINSNTKILIPKTGVSDLLVFGEEELLEKWSIKPEQIPDLKGIMGDPSDNIKGVSGIGEKGAINLLQKYFSLEEIYNNIDEITGATQKKLIDSKEIALLSKEIATIKTDVVIQNFKCEKINLNIDAIIEFLNKYEMFSLVKRLSNRVNNINQEEKIEYQVLKNWDDKLECEENAVIIELLDNNYHKSDVIGISISNQNGNFVLNLFEQGDLNLFNWNEKKEIDEKLQKFLSDPKKIKYFYDLKSGTTALKNLGYLVNLESITYDLMLVGYIKDSSLKSTFSNYLRSILPEIEVVEPEDVFGKGVKKTANIDPEVKFGYLAKKSNALLKSKQPAYDFLNSENLMNLYENIDLKFAKLLFKMEQAGVYVNREELALQTNQIKLKIEQLENEIKDLVSGHVTEDFNIASPKQLKELLYINLKLPDYHKGSTDKEALEKLSHLNPVIEKIMQHRKFSKLYSTYLKGFEKYIFSDNKVHTIYNQTLTTTGRLSSIEPNLQNISIRDEDQKAVRKIFSSEPGWEYQSYDYSQIELRVLAQIAPEKNMLEIFSQKRDIHTEAARLIYNIGANETVSYEMRRTAKIFNFGIIYGLSDFGLSNDLNISIPQAKKFIEAYFKSFPDILIYKEKLVNQGKVNGYVETITKRRRFIYELMSSNYQVRQFGERAALNAPIQGSAADILKLAMININECIIKNNLKSQMIAQIHDEIIFYVPSEESEIVKKIVKEEMQSALSKLFEIMNFDNKVLVELEVSSSQGNDWFELK
ncbi:DNA polymerase I [Spiroplasma alleghenense]|uniref:DNA polymerase I n=1 Tax=Spiroplasma alleghenense TaxID=216931 RepID=A0A345Z450_9MOLU|nr:DNA polymerase I [Spiroplasma alleghenense]AXK51379.1 DNA polymerase I [Spiroplasma alleghenense]